MKRDTKHSKLALNAAEWLGMRVRIHAPVKKSRPIQTAFKFIDGEPMGSNLSA